MKILIFSKEYDLLPDIEIRLYHAIHNLAFHSHLLSKYWQLNKIQLA